MKKLITILLLAAVPLLGHAAGPAIKLDKAHVDLRDQASLQRGAQLFVNYCMGCHSIQYQRYNRMARDLGMTEDEVRENLMFNPDHRIGDTMTIAMPKEHAERWFGTTPPDLSVITRARGSDWLYTFLRTFYVDESRPFGANNAAFPDVGMPNVFWHYQGEQRATFGGSEDNPVLESLTIVPGTGSMSSEQFDDAMRDLTAFLTYVGDPIKVERERLGIWVLLFIAFFTVLAYLLKKDYFKDVH